MGSILLVAEIQKGAIREASYELVSFARKLGGDVKTAADLGLAGQVGAGAAKAQIEKVFVPPKGQGAEMVSGTTDEVVAKLVGKIKELGLL